MPENTGPENSSESRVIGAVPVRTKGEMTFGKTLVAAMLGNLAAGVVVMILAGLIIGLIIASSISVSEEEPIVLDGSLLEIPLSGMIPESQAGADFADILSGISDYTFIELITALDRAAADDRIPGIRLQFNGFSGSSAQYEELVAAIERFRRSGKFVYAFSDTDGLSEGEYYVASAADSVFIHRSGAIELNGLYLVLEFYKPLMDRLNIKPIVVRAGSYKAAVEPFTRSEPSEEYREATGAILDGIQEEITRQIAENRDIPFSQIDSLMQAYPLLRAEEALEFGLVDGILYDDEIDSILRRRLDIEDDDDDVRTLDAADYVRSVREEIRSGSSDDIAVVYASGAITTGDGGKNVNPIMGGNQVGSQRFIRHVRSAREDDDVKAIVIRVDSPGGELSPSIEMWREVSLAAAAKPVVVSMGGVAASGGYYIAAPATEIFADATTVTGSIGVFALAFNLDGLFEETIGINTEVIRTAPHADLLSLTRDMTPEETEFAAREIAAVYDEFLGVVADGRGLDVEEVRQHAEGRVWTGLQARERGLVDEIGGLYASIERAAELAEIEGEYDIVVIPRPLDRFEQIFSMLDDLSQVPARAELLRLEGIRAQFERELRRRSGIQVRLNGWGGVR